MLAAMGFPASLPGDPETYQQFGLYWLQQAGFGETSLGGLSGGTLAAWLALERPQQIDRALVFALI